MRSLSAVGITIDSRARPLLETQGALSAPLDALQPLTQYALNVSVRYSAPSTKFARPVVLKKPDQAYTPRFGKTQYEGWWVMLVYPDGAGKGADELLAVKLISMWGLGHVEGEQAPTKSTRLMFITPEVSGPYALKLYLVSDAYLGLDQEVAIDINVVDHAQMVVPKDPSAFLDKEQMSKYQ